MSETGLRYVVLGAGRQGRAAALDLARHGAAGEIALIDAEADRAEAAARWLDEHAGRRISRPETGDLSEPGRIEGWLEGADACLSAVPYRFNPAVARACLAVGCHHADLGGDPETVAEVLALDEPGREAGVSLVPDCGLAPGLANVLVARGLELAAERAGGDPDAGWRVEVRCGGLPVDPSGPLGYALVFSPWGLLKEYDGQARIVRGGKIETVGALEGLEEVVFEEPPGRCEAFHTVGGASTLPDSFAGRLAELDYKTVRYPGHRDRVRLLRDLGLMLEEPVEPLDGGPAVAPRALLARLLEERLPHGVADLVVLRVEIAGEGLEQPVRLELRELGDESTGLSAMERCTGFPAAAIVGAQARGEVAPGARPPERAVDAEAYVNSLVSREISVSSA